MVNGDFGVSKTVKVFETKEIRENDETSQSHDFLFVIGSRSTIPMNIKSLTFHLNNMKATSANVQLSSAVKKSIRISEFIYGSLIHSMLDFGQTGLMKRFIKLKDRFKDQINRVPFGIKDQLIVPFPDGPYGDQRDQLLLVTHVAPYIEGLEDCRRVGISETKVCRYMLPNQ